MVRLITFGSCDRQMSVWLCEDGTVQQCSALADSRCPCCCRPLTLGVQAGLTTAVCCPPLASICECYCRLSGFGTAHSSVAFAFPCITWAVEYASGLTLLLLALAFQMRVCTSGIVSCSLIVAPSSLLPALLTLQLTSKRTQAICRCWDAAQSSCFVATRSTQTDTVS